MSVIEARLKELGVTLPTAPLPVASYVPCTITGKLGVDVPMEAGQAAAQLCAINVLAQLKAAIGDLDRVVKCVRVGVFVNATPDYTQHPEVANGASDLFAAVFGDAGKHARAAIGVGSLPRGVAVEVDAIFEIK